MLTLSRVARSVLSALCGPRSLTVLAGSWTKVVVSGISRLLRGTPIQHDGRLRVRGGGATGSQRDRGAQVGWSAGPVRLGAARRARPGRWRRRSFGPGGHSWKLQERVQPAARATALAASRAVRIESPLTVSHMRRCAASPGMRPSLVSAAAVPQGQRRDTGRCGTRAQHPKKNCRANKTGRWHSVRPEHLGRTTYD
jgi:hypothetical protein